MRKCPTQKLKNSKAQTESMLESPTPIANPKLATPPPPARPHPHPKIY